MAQDDYFVIAYKLLKYLYDCLKSSARPKEAGKTVVKMVMNVE